MGEGKGMGIALQTSIVFVKGQQSKNRYNYILWETVETHHHFAQNIPSDLKNCQRLLMPRDIYDFAFFLWRNASEKNCQKTSILPAEKIPLW